MIDIHSHLLPGVDDGSPSIEVSVKVLQRFARHGVTTLVCTPHLDASAAADAPYDRYLEILEELRAAAPPEVELRLGWEIMLDLPGADLSDRRLSLGGSGATLVEFRRTSLPPNATEELFRLRMSGIVPVLAHPERYWGCTIEKVREWRSVGAVMQLDAAGLLGGGEMQRLSSRMLEEGLIDLFASDNHGDGRSLSRSRDWLIEHDAAEQAMLLTHTNAERILAGHPPLPVRPLEVRKPGMLDRLREMVLGKPSRRRR